MKELHIISDEDGCKTCSYSMKIDGYKNDNCYRPKIFVCTHYDGWEQHPDYYNQYDKEKATCRNYMESF